jgi:glutamine amidotransferase PdxT|tara:strand:- start:247 stop:501 length:255 start_codon:yes stop_codon:yes gene_type:complete
MYTEQFEQVCKMAGVEPSAVSNLNFKLQEADNINALTKEDHELVKTCAGADLLTSSMSRTYCMLAAGVFARCLIGSIVKKKEDQ